MDTVSVALWLVSTGADLIAKARELWQGAGKPPDEFDAMVDAAREVREGIIAEQRAAELAKLGGK